LKKQTCFFERLNPAALLLKQKLFGTGARPQLVALGNKLLQRVSDGRWEVGGGGMGGGRWGGRWKVGCEV
jgi:hypothetical protein